MDYNKIFEERIERVHREGRYRVFADSEAALRRLSRRPSISLSRARSAMAARAR